jgi:hypothetical protein
LRALEQHRPSHRAPRSVRLEHTPVVFRESIVKPSSVARAACAVAFLALASTAAEAQQPVTKAPPRLPPSPTQTGQIPAGVDSGSPQSSDSLQLGTPIPPSMGAESSEMRARGAAARAAARPKPATSAADCVRPAAVNVSGKGASSSPSAAKAGPTSASAARPTPTGC